MRGYFYKLFVPIFEESTMSTYLRSAFFFSVSGVFLLSFSPSVEGNLLHFLARNRFLYFAAPQKGMNE